VLRNLADILDLSAPSPRTIHPAHPFHPARGFTMFRVVDPNTRAPIFCAEDPRTHPDFPRSAEVQENVTYDPGNPLELSAWPDGSARSEPVLGASSSRDLYRMFRSRAEADRDGFSVVWHTSPAVMNNWGEWLKR